MKKEKSHKAVNRQDLLSALLSLVIVCVFQPALNSQPPLPLYGAAFPQDEVTTVKIIMNPDDLQEMIESQEDEFYYTGTFVFISSELNDTIENVGIRLRGNTSLNAEKKSFRVSFNSFQQGLQWQGLEKLNLVGQQNDPSLLRSKICHDAFREFGIPSCRTSFTKLYINDEYRGLYLNQEHVDEEFAKIYFDNQGDGNLYKCTYPATLEYLGTNPDNYKVENWNGRVYDLRTNEWRDNYTDIYMFINILNNTSIANLPCELPKVFNVENYLKIAALDVMLGNWDGYIYNKNNFHLYQDQRTGLINYIPYDLDNTLGIDWLDRDWGNRNIYNWAPSGEDRPLFKRLMQVQEYRQRFSSHIQDFCNSYFAASNISAKANNLQNLIDDAVEDDSYYELDFGFSFSDFENAVNQAWGGHIDYGIIPFAAERRNTALQQIESFPQITSNVHWLISEWLVDEQTDIIHIDALIEGGEASNCDLLISTDGNSWTNTGNEFADDGNVWDIANDNIYSYFRQNDLGGDKLYYKTSCGADEFPCTPKWMWTTPSLLGVYINEVMSSNTNTIADEHGQFNDWIELYNSNSWSVNLNGKFLTDDLYDWNKFPLPAVSIGPGQFLVIWLDDAPEQGNLHGTFQLGGNDTDLYLVNIEQGVPRIADHFNPVIATTDNSLSRLPDGGTHIELTSEPTPGATNGVINVDELAELALNVYPNPTSDWVNWNRTMDTVTIKDASGRLITSCSNCSSIKLSNLAMGMYFLKANEQVVPVIIQR